MNKHNHLCKVCAEAAGLRHSQTAMPLREWRAFWTRLKHDGTPELDLMGYLDRGCIVCHNSDEDLITDCVINVREIE